MIFAAFDGTVRAVSARDGKLRWSYDAKLGIAGDVVVAGDRVLVGSRSYDLIALDAATGKELWKHYYWFSWIESPPVVRDGVVYTGSSDATNVYAINLEDGSLRWKTAVPGWSWQRTAVNDELVIAGTAGAGAYPGFAQRLVVGAGSRHRCDPLDLSGSAVGRDRQGQQGLGLRCIAGDCRWPGLRSGSQRQGVCDRGEVMQLSTRAAMLLLLGLVASPGDAASPAPCASPEHRQFDFWIGDWRIHKPDGSFAGINRITPEYGGCVIHERYVTGKGYSGESLNIYDAARKVWHQTWVDDTGLLPDARRPLGWQRR